MRPWTLIGAVLCLRFTRCIYRVRQHGKYKLSRIVKLNLIVKDIRNHRLIMSKSQMYWKCKQTLLYYEE